jgi:hypothetical protein
MEKAEEKLSAGWAGAGVEIEDTAEGEPCRDEGTIYAAGTGTTNDKGVVGSVISIVDGVGHGDESEESHGEDGVKKTWTSAVTEWLRAGENLCDERWQGICRVGQGKLE